MLRVSGQSHMHGPFLHVDQFFTLYPPLSLSPFLRRVDSEKKGEGRLWYSIFDNKRKRAKKRITPPQKINGKYCRMLTKAIIINCLTNQISSVQYDFRYNFSCMTILKDLL
jgi:hypothetical protein